MARVDLEACSHGFTTFLEETSTYARASKLGKSKKGEKIFSQATNNADTGLRPVRGHRRGVGGGSIDRRSTLAGCGSGKPEPRGAVAIHPGSRMRKVSRKADDVRRMCDFATTGD